MTARNVPIRFAVPPGQIIRGELEARKWTQERLAAEMGRPYQPINEIVNGRKRITAETAIELALAFGTSDVYWMNLQTAYDLYRAHQKRGLIAKAKLVVARRSVPPENVSSRSKSRDADVSEVSEQLQTKHSKRKVTH